MSKRYQLPRSPDDEACKDDPGRNPPSHSGPPFAFHPIDHRSNFPRAGVLCAQGGPEEGANTETRSSGPVCRSCLAATPAVNPGGQQDSLLPLNSGMWAKNVASRPGVRPNLVLPARRDQMSDVRVSEPVGARGINTKKGSPKRGNAGADSGNRLPTSAVDCGGYLSVVAGRPDVQGFDDRSNTHPTEVHRI